MDVPATQPASFRCGRPARGPADADPRERGHTGGCGKLGLGECYRPARAGEKSKMNYGRIGGSGALLGLGLVALPARGQPTARFPDPAPATAPTPAPKPARKPTSPPTNESWARRAARLGVERAERRLRQGDTALAVREYTEALRMDPSFGAAYLGLGSVRELLRDWREADRVYSAATRFPDSKAEALARRSAVRRALGRDDEAFSDLESAVSETPQRRWLRTLGDWYVERRAWPAALNAWRRLLALAEREGSSDRDEARLRVRALSVLAAESDPVLYGEDHPSWVRRSLAAIARRVP
jgi:tetratricopeptide (TPR) repeat protein